MNQVRRMFGGTIGGNQLVVAGIDFDFIGGSMGGAVGEAITRGAELALEKRLPLLVISAPAAPACRRAAFR